MRRAGRVRRADDVSMQAELAAAEHAAAAAAAVAPDGDGAVCDDDDTTAALLTIAAAQGLSPDAARAALESFREHETRLTRDV